MSADEKIRSGRQDKDCSSLWQIEEGTVKAVFETTGGIQLNVAFGKDLPASVNVRQVVEKLPPPSAELKHS
jgi:hypothetical protein